MAEKYPGWSPFNYTLNNPINLIDPSGKSVEDGEIYNLNGEHIGSDGKDDNRVYLLHTTSKEQLTQEQSLQMTNAYNNQSGDCSATCENGFEFTEVPITNDELNLRASLSTLKQAEAGPANAPLDYNSWNNGANFTNDAYESNPNAYAKHPGMNSPHGSAAGAYQFLQRFYNESDFSPQSQDRAAVKNMTSTSYKAALSGDMSKFIEIETTKSRWTSLSHWSSSKLQKVFNQYRANELTGNSNIVTPVGSLLRKK